MTMMFLPAATSDPGKGRGGRCSPRQKNRGSETRRPSPERHMRTSVRELLLSPLLGCEAAVKRRVRWGIFDNCSLEENRRALPNGRSEARR